MCLNCSILRFFIFVILGLSSVGFAKTSVVYSLNGSFTAIKGSDDVWPSVSISSDPGLGLGARLVYNEEDFLTLYGDVSYRYVTFKNDTKNNIEVHSTASPHDVGLKFSVGFNFFERFRLIFEQQYKILYYYESVLFENYVNLYSEMGLLIGGRVEYDILKQPSALLRAYVPFGISQGVHRMNQGIYYGCGLDFKMLRVGANQYILGLSYLENYQKSRDTNQALADLNLSFGLEKSF